MPPQAMEPPADPPPPPPDSSQHLEVSKRELERIKHRIEDDVRAAAAENQRRIEKCIRYWRKWRSLYDAPLKGDENKSNYIVPVMQWQVFATWAQIMQALLGADAEIVASPTGPSDQKTVVRVGVFMTWRVFASMKIANALCVFILRMIIFGRSHAYAPYVRETYRVKGKDEVSYEGPGFVPLWPDEIITPGEDVECIQDFSWCVRRFWATPAQLLQGEREGRYFGIEDNFEKILHASRQNGGHSITSLDGDGLRDAKNEAEGIDTWDGTRSGAELLECWEWYGRRRMPKRVTEEVDYDEYDVKGRDLDETELVVRYLPDAGLQLIVGIQDLAEMYPHMQDRRPIVEASMIKDGSYWSAGYGELLEDIQDEVSANHNLFTDAGAMTVNPPLIMRPGNGLAKELKKLEPGIVLFSDDPGSAQQLKVQADLQYCVVKEQAVLAYAERLTGRSDNSLGRGIDRPNAPRTATGQIALIEQGNVRAGLDMLTLREDLRRVLQHFWRLDTYFSPRDLFFRVTEEDAGGIWDDVRDGFATLTPEEREGNFDFDLKFATSVWSKQAQKQEQLTLYQLDLQNPLIVQNPQALWSVTNSLHKALGDEEFSEIVPAPPVQDTAKTPKQEWTLALEGEDFDVHPADNDDQHITDHMRRVIAERGKPSRDEDAVNRMLSHIVRHEEQKQAKMLLQQQAAAMADAIAPLIAQHGAALMTGQHPSQQEPEEEGSGKPAAKKNAAKKKPTT